MKQVYQIPMGQPKKITLPKICACIFFGCFFFGVLFANLTLSDQALWIGFVNENQIRQFAIGEREVSDFLLFALKSRMIPWCILVICGVFSLGIIVYGLWFGWLGLSGGFVMAALLQRYGIRGILILCGIGCPQYLIYLAAYVILLKLMQAFWEQKRKGVRDLVHGYDKKKQTIVYLLFAVFISAVFSLGIWTEFYVNPFLLNLMK